jgi:hypothetical protein
VPLTYKLKIPKCRNKQRIQRRKNQNLKIGTLCDVDLQAEEVV